MHLNIIERRKRMNKTIAVDFDGCLCENKFPAIGQPNLQAIRDLKKEVGKGNKVILWTCRENKSLVEAVTWCKNQGLFFDAVNDNLPEHIKIYGSNSRKVCADEYWDDKSKIVKYSNS